MRKTVRVLIATLMLSAVGVFGFAQPASAAPCGYSEDDRWAYWRNCNDLNDYIGVDTVLWPDRYYCVPRGQTMNVGNATYTRGARLIYDGCPA